MKLFKLCFVLFLLTGFSACENHMDIQDVVKGTPSRADTVLPHSFAPHEITGSKPANEARVFLR